ncbi:CLUMA_CG019874, isoform A [Clunio marinus]|uniref:CLUMA_CG019874, isoform A n=1 Tax=Clunio marinus TaxID=568069 RepID=A0A1J1J1X2_9DIPT|nr:CLUMA_CG019874, isoform A [Clunio marinus]
MQKQYYVFRRSPWRIEAENWFIVTNTVMLECPKSKRQKKNSIEYDERFSWLKSPLEKATEKVFIWNFAVVFTSQIY